MQIGRRHSMSVLLLWFVLVGNAHADWSLFEQTHISESIRGAVRKGRIFKTASGHFYEVAEYVYLYEYEYRPDVVVLRDGDLYKLAIEGFEQPLLCRRLDNSPAPQSVPTDDQENLVVSAQRALSALGFFSGKVDGVYSEQSRSAVAKFQDATGLTASGELDSKTLTQIAEALRDKHPNNIAMLEVGLHLLQGAQGRLSAESGLEPPTEDEDTAPPTGTATATPNVIESNIVSEFRGLDHGNIYKLTNGQIWEQTEFWIWIWYWVGPKVLIWNDNGIYRMKVDQIDHAVMVRRLR